jgi:YVTN family beta-propeller protein
VITTVQVGDFPWVLAYNPTNNKIFCANGYSDNVTIIDGAGDTVITTVGVGDYPYALAYNPTNNKIYCANYYSDNITIIDGTSNLVITTVGVGYGPSALAYNSTNNKIYCANSYSANVTVIDGANNSVTGTVVVGDGPGCLAYNSTNNKVYCVNNSGSSISVIACSPSTAVEEEEEGQVIPSFALHQNYPNPFNPSTKIPFTVRGSPFLVHSPFLTTLKIYNILGQKVRTLVDEPKRAGSYEVIWDGKDGQGKEVVSGIYFYQLKAGDYTETKKMILLK